MSGIGKSFQPFGTGKCNFGYIPDPPEPEDLDEWEEEEEDLNERQSTNE